MIQLRRKGQKWRIRGGAGLPARQSPGDWRMPSLTYPHIPECAPYHHRDRLWTVSPSYRIGLIRDERQQTRSTQSHRGQVSLRGYGPGRPAGVCAVHAAEELARLMTVDRERFIFPPTRTTTTRNPHPPPHVTIR